MSFLDSIRDRFGGSFGVELLDVIEKYAPQASRFLEWGSGESTELLCRIANAKPKPFVLSIDDNEAYLRKVAESLPPYPFLHLRCLDLQGPSTSQNDQPPSYSSYPHLVGLRFDVAFVDGRRRVECAVTASQVLVESGIIIVHDWRRSRYAILRDLLEVLNEGEQFLVLRPSTSSSRRLPRSRESRALVIPARGPRAVRELEVTLPFAQAYAERVGADCIVVGQSSALPPHRLKFEAFETVRSYDRTLLIDADVIIREGSPDIFDIVPPQQLGAFPEGQYFAREDWCQTLATVYGEDHRVQPHQYFNSGVLVLSNHICDLVGDLGSDLIFGQPLYEQGFLNARRVARKIDLFHLLPDFNYIPDPSVFSIDWRCGYFIHYAGTGKSKILHPQIWKAVDKDVRTFSPAPFATPTVRAGLLRQAAEQMAGKAVKMLDPTDFRYQAGQAYCVEIEGEMVAYFPELRSGGSGQLALFGPYVELDAGSWKAEFRGRDGEIFVYEGATLDVVCNTGTSTIASPRDWPEDGVLLFQLPTRTSDVEFRIFRPHTAAEFAWLRIERIG